MGNVDRRTILKAGAAVAASALAMPPLLSFGRGERTVKIGMIDPVTSVYAAEGSSEINGARMALDEVNGKGGVIGRPLELIVEDAAANAGIAQQKAYKLVDRDEVDMLMGAVSSAVALSINQAAHDRGKVYMVTGGHTDPVTGSECHWNTFRICTTTWMLANGLASTLLKKFGKRWYFITPDYAYGHSIQSSYAKILGKAGGTVLGNSLTPLGATDFSSYLIAAQAAKPDVLMVLVGGGDQLTLMKQAAQFGLPQRLTMGGGLSELEVLSALPSEARRGWWELEWWWDQPKQPHVSEFVAAYRKRYDKTPSARSWFGYAGVHSLAMGANHAKSVEGVKVARALEGMELPPEVALQPNKIYFRAADHQLMSNIFPGEALSTGKDPNLFRVAEVVDGDSVALPPSETGCKLDYKA
jgi:branched-chain amino acid transport system substrate-binding protein